MIRRVAAIGIAVLLVLSLQAKKSEAAWYLGWLDWHVLGQADWVMTGPGTATRSLDMVHGTGSSTVPNWRFMGAQGVAGTGNAKGTIGVTINDVTTTGCSSVTVELQVSGVLSSCLSEGGGSVFHQDKTAFESKTWSTCIGGSNSHYYSTGSFYRTGEKPIFIDHNDGNITAPTSGKRCYGYRIGLVDDFGSALQSRNYAVQYY